MKYLFLITTLVLSSVSYSQTIDYDAIQVVPAKETSPKSKQYYTCLTESQPYLKLVNVSTEQEKRYVCSSSLTKKLPEDRVADIASIEKITIKLVQKNAVPVKISPMNKGQLDYLDDNYVNLYFIEK